MIIITLIGTSTTSLVACNTQKYNETELKELKENNNINTKDGILEWIAPQEKPFNQVDNKYYFVVWRGVNSKSKHWENDWNIVKFKNDTFLSNEQTKSIDLKNNYKLYLYKIPNTEIDLFIKKNDYPIPFVRWRGDKNNTCFKSVYWWNSNIQEPNFNLIVDTDDNIKVK